MDEEATSTSFWVVLLVLWSVLLLVVVLVLSFLVMSDDMIRYDAGWIYERLGVTEKAAALKMLGLIIAGIVALWGVVAANRRADALAESAKATVASAKVASDSVKATAESAKAASESVKATEAGNRQRAFRDGVEHLGSDKASMRLIGARALFYVAMEDEKQRMDIVSFLCAYIRETTGNKDYQEQNKDRPSIEVQSLLKLLFTTETMDEGRLERFWKGITPDLEGGYFRGVELEGARFRGVKLNSAQFHRALLGEAQFQGARLRGAQFQQASLGRAQFQGAWLWGAQFQEARLDQAQFQRASLGEAQFQWAGLKEAQFQGAGLKEARFQGALLEEAQFQGASLEGAQFQGAWLERAQFQGADLERAQLQGAWPEGAQFQGASLHMAGFQQAKFGQGSEHEDIPDQGGTVAKSDELVEQLKASAFHGASSEPLVLTSFEERINDRTGKASDFSGVIFSGGVTQELLAEVKEALERASRLFSDPDFKEKVIRGLESEIGQPESHTPPKGVIAGSYGKEDAERWIREFREATATVPETNQAA